MKKIYNCLKKIITFVVLFCFEAISQKLIALDSSILCWNLFKLNCILQKYCNFFDNKNEPNMVLIYFGGREKS